MCVLLLVAIVRLACMHTSMHACTWLLDLEVEISNHVGGLELSALVHDSNLPTQYGIVDNCRKFLALVAPFNEQIDFID